MNINWSKVQENLPNTEEIEKAISFLQYIEKQTEVDYYDVEVASDKIVDLELREKFVDTVLDEIEANNPEYQNALVAAFEDLFNAENEPIADIYEYLQQLVGEVHD